MQQFLGLLGEEVEPAPLTPETLFDTVIMASPRKTLRRATLIFAGRIPTDAEYAAVEGGDESVLRATIRGLMEGPQFHEFLIRASNDRLLTDREGRVIDAAANNAMFVDLSNLYHQKAVAVSQGRLDEGIWRRWEGRVQFGIRRAPLELIAPRGRERPTVHGDPHRRLHHGEPDGSGGLWGVDGVRGSGQPVRVSAVQDRQLLPPTTNRRCGNTRWSSEPR